MPIYKDDIARLQALRIDTLDPKQRTSEHFEEIHQAVDRAIASLKAAKMERVAGLREARALVVAHDGCDFCTILKIDARIDELEAEDGT